MERLGRVISNPMPSSMEFVFLAEKPVVKNTFVRLENGIIGKITEVYKTNRYLQRAENVHYFEHSGVDIKNRFPVDMWEYSLAKVRIVGKWTDKLERNVAPPSPGEDVFLVENQLLNKILGFDERGLELGSLDFHNIPVKINLTKLLQKHLAILAMSGAGKSYATSVLIEELLDRPKKLGRVGVVLIDVHGEYLGFGERPKNGEKDYSLKTKVIKRIKIGVPELSAGMIAEFIPGISGPQKRELEKILAELNKERISGGEPFGFEEVIRSVEESEMHSNTKTSLISWLSDLNATGLFSDHSELSITDLARPGQLTVVDLSNIVDLRRKQIIVTWIAKKLFEERRKDTVPPFLLIVEEAHNFAREGVSRDQAISRGVIETIAREGRKFGASLCLISQRPIQLSTTALSQCNNQLILRVTNPYDLKHIGESSEAIDQSSLDSITTLRVGEALLVGEAVNFPIFFRVRKRRSQELKLGKDLEELAKEWENREKQEEEDVQAFL